MFWLKKVVSFWLMPLPLCLALLALSSVLAFLRRKSPFWRAPLLAATLVLFFFANSAVSTWLLRPLEQRYAAIGEMDGRAPKVLASCVFVVVLGGGHSDTDLLSATNKLAPSSLERIVEGVRILRVLPSAQLIVSGPAAPGNPTHASVLSHAAESLGVAPGRILQIDTARDTEEEAAAVRRMVGNAPVALVTSAGHMPRAAALFRHAGVTAVPCPTDYGARDEPSLNPTRQKWDAESLERSTRAVHERLGLLWLTLRGLN